MVRKAISYVLLGTILLAQGGLPLHMHYCKGMLESISVFFTAGCDDHEEVVDLPACCKKESSDTCSSKASDCCDDEVKVLLQDFDSLIPHIDKLDQTPALAKTERTFLNHSFITYLHVDTDLPNKANGPPTYILFHSLIYYA